VHANPAVIDARRNRLMRIGVTVDSWWASARTYPAVWKASI
jgi:hypothetical protein